MGVLGEGDVHRAIQSCFGAEKESMGGLSGHCIMHLEHAEALGVKRFLVAPQGPRTLIATGCFKTTPMPCPLCPLVSSVSSSFCRQEVIAWFEIQRSARPSGSQFPEVLLELLLYLGGFL